MFSLCVVFVAMVGVLSGLKESETQTTADEYKQEIQTEEMQVIETDAIESLVNVKNSFNDGNSIGWETADDEKISVE